MRESTKARIAAEGAFMTHTLVWLLERPVPDCAYNLFRDPQRPALFCAVPVDRPVPAFLDRWEFVRCARENSEFPPGYDERAARVGVHYNGFYLFQTTRMSERPRTLVIADRTDEPCTFGTLEPSTICLTDDACRWPTSSCRRPGKKQKMLPASERRIARLTRELSRVEGPIAGLQQQSDRKADRTDVIVERSVVLLSSHRTRRMR
jgi:hypothetical protein